MNFLQLLFSPYGSIKRLRFFLGMVSITLITIVILVLISFITQTYLSNLGLEKIPGRKNVNAMLQYETVYYPILMVLVSVYTAWVKLCLTMKRLRDLALSPWFVVIILGVESLVYLPIVATSLWMQAILAIVMLGFLLGLLFWPSRLAKQQ